MPQYAKKSGCLTGEPLIDPEKEAPYIAELVDDLRAVLESEERKAIYDKVVAWLYCIEADYHLGRITLEELLERLEEYIEPRQEYKDKMIKLMEKSVLFHDIGKYFCLDYVSNSSRNLTDDEFEIIMEHLTNFSKIYQGEMSRKVECVHDCALFHHLWYNEKGGYPKGKHTANQPFVNIISIADSIDAATDNIGRPYGQGKTLGDLLEEFEGMKDSRYSGYICDLLHVEEVKAKIERILDERRREIYYNTQTSHTQSGIRTLKNQYFSPQNTFMRLIPFVPAPPAYIGGGAVQSWT